MRRTSQHTDPRATTPHCPRIRNELSRPHPHKPRLMPPRLSGEPRSASVAYCQESRASQLPAGTVKFRSHHKRPRPVDGRHGPQIPTGSLTHARTTVRRLGQPRDGYRRAILPVAHARSGGRGWRAATQAARLPQGERQTPRQSSDGGFVAPRSVPKRPAHAAVRARFLPTSGRPVTTVGA
jgi:hypothetical protein